MTTITIFPDPSSPDTSGFLAISGAKHSAGPTVGQALDALTAQMGPEERGTMVVVQNMQPDSFFSAGQRTRLEELMTRWREAREGGMPFPPKDKEELDALVDAELEAAAKRAASFRTGLGS